MKITCDACDTKYSIGDDKVAGKAFKIRCKKCSHIIIVRGVTAPVESPVTVGTDDDWYAVVDGQQLGPFDSREITRRHAAGELADDACLWREGMSDWAPLGSIDAFRRSEARAPSIAPDAPVEAAAEATRLRGERNETSVLFTLGNLVKLAAPAPAPATSSATATASSIEGSGLIDIRALASTLAPEVARPTTMGSSVGSMADLPVYAPSGFADPIVLVPTASRRTPNRLVMALVALGAMLVTVTSVLIVVVMKKPDQPAPTRVADISVPPRSTDTVVEPAASPPAASPPVVSPPAALPPAATPPAASPPAASPASASHRHPRAAGKETPPAASPPPSTPRPARRVLSTAPPEEKCTEITCELSNFGETCCERFKPASTTTGADSKLPEQLDRDSLKAGIATINVKGCSGRSKGDVSVSIKVSPAGAVTKVTIKSSPDTAAGDCVTAAAQKGTFAKTRRGGSFAYLWRL